MQCEMCGKEVEDYFRARIEGTVLNVCEKCCRFGRVLEPVKAQSREPVRQADVVNKPVLPDVVEELVEDFALKIKSRREKLGLTQEELAKKINEKESILQKVESGHFTPSIKLAKKLENFLGLKLVEEVEEQKVLSGRSGSSGGGFTLGDFVKVRK